MRKHWVRQRVALAVESLRQSSLCQVLPTTSRVVWSYTNEVKENILKVSHEVLEEQTAVCEEVAREMVLGAIDALKVDFAISATGVAGPTGGTAEIPVGTIWIGYGSKDDVRTLKLTEDFGRDINLAIATNTALKSMFGFLKEYEEDLKKEG